MALPYLGFIDKDNELYRNTRRFVLSHLNPYWFKGAALRGVGGPHIGLGWVWPMAIAIEVTEYCQVASMSQYICYIWIALTKIKARTARNAEELVDAINRLKQASSGSGFMHEAVWMHNPERFTRAWFAWANSVFGDLISWVLEEKPFGVRI